MTRHHGFSCLPNPTADQLAQLADALMSGRLSRFFVDDGAAYYRRSHGVEFQLMDAVSPELPVTHYDPHSRTMVPSAFLKQLAVNASHELIPNYLGEDVCEAALSSDAEPRKLLAFAAVSGIAVGGIAGAIYSIMVK